ncbi:MAG: LacI family transcriptional regulator [Rariglobus sp.]|jgi:LacI family transcriptional regulator|nr:LacI family transcriptional regulator [Rariglobus sp.]
MADYKLPTTRDIAAATGYSQSAVSHALRGTQNISAETKEKILRAAGKLGWKPNPFASAYMSHLRRTKGKSAYRANLAYLIYNPESGRVTDQPPHIQYYFRGASKRARELGYEVEPVWLNEPHLTPRRLNGILRSRNISGLFVPGVEGPAAVLKQLQWRNFASVAIGFIPSKSEIHRVTADTFDGFALLLDNIRKLGYRRIGVAVSRAYDEQVNHGVLFPTYFSRERWRADCTIEVCDFATDQPHEIPVIQEWLRAYRPEVVLGETVSWRAITRMGWRVPQDIAFASVDWSARYAEIAGFNQRHELQGALAVDMVSSQITHNEQGLPANPRVVLVAGSWKAGKSVPAAEKRTRIVGSVKIDQG